MTLRRDFLSMTAGAVAARTVLPIRANAKPVHNEQVSHPDAALIAICAQHKIALHALNHAPSELQDDDPLWHAYDFTRDAISDAKPSTLDGIVAKASAAKAEARNPNGEYVPEGSMGEIWAWDLVQDLLAMGAA